MSEVDRLTVIAYWAIWNAPERGENSVRVRRLPHPDSKLYQYETAVVDAASYRGAVEALRPFAVADSEFEGDDAVQVLVGVTRSEAAAIRAIVGGQ